MAGIARFAVLLVGTEYSTFKGDISTINHEVARVFAAAGTVVYCTVLEATEQDERDAERDGVRLLKPRLDADSSGKPSLEWLTVYHKHHFPHIPSDVGCIVGHVDVTGTAARKIKEERFPHAKLAMFGHVAPEETEHYKSDEKALGVGRKEASIQEDIGKADVVFSVGSRIHRHYDRFLRRNRVDHYIFLPEPSKVFRYANVSFAEESEKVRKPERSVLSIGRVQNVEGLKGHDLAAGAMDKVAQRLDGQYTLRLRIRGIDENDFKESKRILEEKLRSGRVRPTLLPYGTQEDIRRDMENCHLVLMPSRAEPFGLVGLEAIAAGVPVLISEHSGLAELIEELSDRLRQPTFRHCIVKMKGDTATDGDAEKWAERIEDVLKNARSEFAEVRAFREKLLASRYWEESHMNLLRACGVTGPIELELGGPEMRALYDQACKEGFYQVFNTTLMLVGKHGNGKSSLRSSLLQLKFDQSEKNTDGIVMTTCIMTGKKKWKITGEKKDTDSEYAYAVGMEMKERSEKTKQYPEHRQEEEEPSNHEEESPQQQPANEAADTAVSQPEASQQAARLGSDKSEEEYEGAIGTDLGEDNLSETFQQAARFAKGKDDLSDIVGSKERPAMSIWDFAGHDLYYSNHHVFYSHFAIYILTLNLTTPINAELKDLSDDDEDQTGSCAEALQLKTEGDVVDYHLESIRAHTRPNRNVLGGDKAEEEDEEEGDKEPRVIVVGTHKDQLEDQKRDIKAFRRDVKKHLKGKDAINKHVHDRYFAIDNVKRDPEDPELSDLRDCILKIAQEQNHMGRRIPISWLDLKSKLMKKKEVDKTCTLDTVIDLNDSSPVSEEFTPEQTAVIILRFFHLCGDIIFFDTPELHKFVVLDPQWFVDVQKTIITIPKYRLDGKIKQWERLEDEGMLEDSLVDAVWENKRRQEVLKCNLKDHKDELLLMMEKFDVVLRCSPESEDETNTTTPSPGKPTYFVPSLLTAAKDEAKLYPKGTKRSKPVFAVFKGRFCPIGLYHRLVIACMRRYNKLPSRAYANCARFVTINPRQTFVITKERHYLKVELLSSIKEESACFGHGPGVREGLEEDLWWIIHDWIPGIEYKWCFLCCCEGHKEEEREEDRFLQITDEKVKEWFEEGEAVCEWSTITTIEDIGLAHWYPNTHEDAKQNNKAPEQERTTGGDTGMASSSLKRHSTNLPLAEVPLNKKASNSVAKGHKRIILLINDEYGTSKGGVSTINCGVGQTLAAAGAIVYATTLRVPKQDQEAAKNDRVQLIKPYQRAGDTTEPSIGWLAFEYRSRYPKPEKLPPHVDVIIGHANITDTAARNIKDDYYQEADLMTFNHVIPEDTEYYKGAFSVGKRIYDYFDTEYKGDKKPLSHYLFLPKPSDIFLAKDVRPGGEQKRVLSVGRVRNAEKQKGHDLAAQSMRDVIKRIPNVRLCVRGISEEDFEVSMQILRDNLDCGDLNPDLRCYGTQEDIRDDMMTAHLVLMPSRSEPFGLVGLEAIAAGIPVLISDKTGLAWMINDLIKQGKLHPDRRHVIVETSVNDNDPAGDAKRWADKIVGILTYSDSEFEKAARFKRELVESRYWEESHRTFLQACGITTGTGDQ
ncbi:Hypp7899 [Branchiostoma lanceolatum]|uniref:Hypp7899 protein n=1 Tax=Branchiostoma lanceolatum TaxID=7740 RepID=A0A8J9Z486_BRALA|nr:Hypp7899 [Branchiostoma lanceolatum]